MSSLLLLVSKIKDMPQLNSVFVGSNRFVLPALAKEQFLVMFFFFFIKLDHLGFFLTPNAPFKHSWPPYS